MKYLPLIVILLMAGPAAAECVTNNQVIEGSYDNPNCYTEAGFYTKSDPTKWKWELVPENMIPSISPPLIEKYYGELKPSQRKQMTKEQIIRCFNQINDLTTEVDRNRAQRAILERFNSLVDLGSGAAIKNGVLHATYGNEGYVKLEKTKEKQIVKIDEHGNVLLLNNKAPPADGRYTLIYNKEQEVVLPDHTKIRSKGSISYSKNEDGSSYVYVKKGDSAYVNGVSIIQPTSENGIRIFFKENDAAVTDKRALPSESLTFYANDVVAARSSGVQLEFDRIMATPTERRRFVLGATKNSEDAILLVDIPVDLQGGTLRKGNRGQDVQLLQKRINGFLAANNINQMPINENGIFGKDTEEALKAVQRKLGLKPDGIFGKDTNIATSPIQYLQGSIQILQDGLIYNDGSVLQVPKIRKLKSPLDNLHIDFRIPMSTSTGEFLNDHSEIRTAQDLINYVLLKPGAKDPQRWQKAAGIANSLGFDLNDLVAYRDALRSEGIRNEDILIDKYFQERTNHISVDTGATNYKANYVEEIRVVTTDQLQEASWQKIIPSRVDEKTRNDFETMCNKLGIDPAGLAMLIKTESQWNTKGVNPDTLASGIFQIVPDTAAYLLGEPKPTTMEDRTRLSNKITAMSETEQINLMEKYFTTIKKSYPNANLNSIEDISVAAFYPQALNYPPEGVIGDKHGSQKQQRIYEQNRGLDKDKDSVITRNEYAAYLKGKMNKVNKIVLAKKL